MRKKKKLDGSSGEKEEKFAGAPGERENNCSGVRGNSLDHQLVRYWHCLWK